MPNGLHPSLRRHLTLHLRALNPHVTSVFDSHASKSGGARSWLAHRQDGPPVQAPGQLCGSVSSFAYQGTNSHAVLGPVAAVPLAQPQGWQWQRARLWYVATAHPLLLRFLRPARAVAREVQVQCSLRSGALAWMHEHAVQGRAAAPNSVLLEVASAAGQLLWSSERTHNPVVVASAAFQQPLLLAPAADGLLTCSVSAATGAVAVSSRALPTSQAAPLHMVAELHSLATGPQEQEARSKPSAADAQAEQRGGGAAAAAAQQGAAGIPWCSEGLAAVLLGTGLVASAQPAVIASILMTQRERDAGYWAHPAVTDAAVHLAAAAPAHQATGADGESLLVSVAVGAYAPVEQLAPGDGALHAGALPGAGLTSSHWVASGQAPSRLAAVAGNQFKPIRAWAPMAAGAAVPAAAQLPFLPSMVVAGSSAAGGLSAAAGAPGLEAVTQQLSEVVAQLLGRSEVPTDQPLMEAGLDSIGAAGACLLCCRGCCGWAGGPQPPPGCGLVAAWALWARTSLACCPLLCVAPGAGAVELRNAVGARFGIDLPATVSFDYPSIDALAGYISGQAAGGSMQPQGQAPLEQQDLEAARQAVLSLLLDTAAGLVGAEVAPDQPLMEAGLDSIGGLGTARGMRSANMSLWVCQRPRCGCRCAGAVEFRNAVQAAFGVELPATVTFDYPSAAAMSGYIAARMAPAQPAQPTWPGQAVSMQALQPAPQQHGSITEIVGWAAEAATPGGPHTCERSAAALANRTSLLLAGALGNAPRLPAAPAVQP